jgi:hypothetical protein
MKQSGWLLIGFLIFTGTEGQRIWIVPSQIVSVQEPVAPYGYAMNCKAIITTLSNTFCVTEQPADIVQQLEHSK